jgi:hypothetical protein
MLQRLRFTGHGQLSRSPTTDARTRSLFCTSARTALAVQALTGCLLTAARGAAAFDRCADAVRANRDRRTARAGDPASPIACSRIHAFVLSHAGTDGLPCAGTRA